MTLNYPQINIPESASYGYSMTNSLALSTTEILKFSIFSLSLSLSLNSLSILSLSLSLPVSHSFTLLSLSLAFYPFIFVLFPFQTSNYVVGNVDSQGIARGAARTRLSLFQFHNFLFSLRLILHFFFS